MVYCTKCGFENADSSKFCITCGNKLDVNISRPNPQNDFQNNPEPMDYNPNNQGYEEHHFNSNQQYNETNYNNNNNSFEQGMNDVGNYINDLGNKTQDSILNYRKNKEEKHARKIQDKNALYYLNGREAELFAYEDYLEFDFTEDYFKKITSRWGGVKKIYYHQINSIQKRDAGSLANGSLEFEVQGNVRGKQQRIGNFNENLVHYYKKYEAEATALYEFVNQKIIESHKGVTQAQVVKTEDGPLDKLKKSKELLDMGAISPDEYEMIKEKLLKEI
ncbi:zinc-ribbon domain-containing protein [Methanosphaera sp. WGK6]|uniref:zinc-ribbon domain-containing protein n=1 Tax=Methanosphaera sp. WGK6 TaxID=1561964 RepID=UPI00084BF2CF|nr:zinc-ribbon domain-containing protein [Methanosphaera sp. WGK6]